MLDPDDNGVNNALTDGLLILRYLFNFTDATLTDNAVAAGANRSTPADITAFLMSLDPLLDVDSNNDTDALTDGLLILRYLFNFTDATLITNAIGENAVRTEAGAIEDYLSLFKLPLPPPPALPGPLPGLPNRLPTSRTVLVTPLPATASDWSRNAAPALDRHSVSDEYVPITLRVMSAAGHDLSNEYGASEPKDQSTSLRPAISAPHDKVAAALALTPFVELDAVFADLIPLGL